MASDIRKEATLVKAVFSCDDGKKLLEIWKAKYKPVLKSTDKEQNVLLGAQLHLEDVEYLFNATPKEIKEMEEASTYQTDTDF